MQKVRRFVFTLVLLAALTVPAGQALAIGGNFVGGPNLLQSIWIHAVLWVKLSAVEAQPQPPTTENGLTMDPNG